MSLRTSAKAHIHGSLWACLFLACYTMPLLAAVFFRPEWIVPWLISTFTLFLLSTGLFLFLTPLLWPLGAASHWAMRKLGYTNWHDYLVAGATLGLLLGILIPFVDTAPESNGYAELLGWARAKLFLVHYIRTTTLGILFALSYWYAYNPKRKPEPELPQQVA